MSSVSVLTQSGRVARKDGHTDLLTKPTQLKQKLRMADGQENVNDMEHASKSWMARGHRLGHGVPI